MVRIAGFSHTMSVFGVLYAQAAVNAHGELVTSPGGPGSKPSSPARPEGKPTGFVSCCEQLLMCMVLC